MTASPPAKSPNHLRIHGMVAIRGNWMMKHRIPGIIPSHSPFFTYGSWYLTVRTNGQIHVLDTCLGSYSVPTLHLGRWPSRPTPPFFKPTNALLQKKPIDDTIPTRIKTRPPEYAGLLLKSPPSFITRQHCGDPLRGLPSLTQTVCQPSLAPPQVGVYSV